MNKFRFLTEGKLIFRIWGEQLRECPRLSLYQAANGIACKLQTILGVILPAMIVNCLIGGSGVRRCMVLIVLYALAASLLGFLGRSANLIADAYGYQSINLRLNKINKKAMSLDYKDTEDADVLDKMETAKDSVWEFNDVGYAICTDLLGNFLSLGAMSAIFLMLNPWVYPVALVMTALSTYAERRKLKITHDSHACESKARRQANYCKELLQNQKLGKEIRAYRADEFLLEKYHSAQAEYLHIIEAREKALWKWSLLQRCVYFLQLILTYTAAIAEYRQGGIAIGSFLMYVSASKELFFVVQEIFDNFVELSLVAGYYGDYLEFMKRKEEMSQTGRADVPENEQGTLEFRNVSFTYPAQSEPAVHNVSFIIKPGDKIAFVGDNGAGKSTLIKLLLRLYDPTGGVIYYNGKDIKSYRYEEYLGLFSCAFQDFRLFSYTLKENICFDDENQAKLHSAIAQAMLNRVIEKCPDGLETCLGKEFSDQSVDLSGGEAQSVAIARAFYKDGPIAVFDEPTAALDPIREQAIYQHLGEFCRTKTAVFVSHRMGSTVFCNHIFVFDHGELIEQGTHDALMRKRGVYYDMYENQACYYR